MAEETQQEAAVLPPENVPTTYRPYYAQLVDRALEELKKGRNEVEIRIELNKFIPPKVFLEEGNDQEEAISDAILYAKSIFSPGLKPELIRIEPIIEKLGASEPPKSSDLFDMLKTLKAFERTIRTAGFEAQRVGLRSSLEELKNNLDILKVPTQSPDAVLLRPSIRPSVEIVSQPGGPQELLRGGIYQVVFKQTIQGRVSHSAPQSLTFKNVATRADGEYLIFAGFLNLEVAIKKEDIVSLKLTHSPTSALGLVQATTPAPPLSTGLVTGAPQPALFTPLPTTSPLEPGTETLILPAGTEDTRNRIDAKLREGFVLSRVVSNSDGTATFYFTRVTAVAQPSPSFSTQPSPTTGTPFPATPAVSFGGFSVGDTIDVDFYDTPPDNRRRAKITGIELRGSQASRVDVATEFDNKSYSWDNFLSRKPVKVF